jgi:hypothetical protein
MQSINFRRLSLSTSHSTRVASLQSLANMCTIPNRLSPHSFTTVHLGTLPVKCTWTSCPLPSSQVPLYPDFFQHISEIHFKTKKLKELTEWHEESRKTGNNRSRFGNYCLISDNRPIFSVESFGL